MKRLFYLHKILLNSLCFFILISSASLSAQVAQVVGSGIHCSSGDTSQLCDNMQLICLNNSFPLPVSGPVAPVGNDYGCLFTQPNPVWFVMNVGTSGSIYMALTSSTGVDLDYIVWGPYATMLDAKNACGNLGNGGTGGLVDTCSYSAAAVEYIGISNAIAGQVYILMVTNFSNTPTAAILTNVSGTGSITCGLGLGSSLIAGTVYEDTDGDCTQDSSEQGLAGRLVILQPGGFLATTSADGSYGFCGIDVNNYTVELLVDTFLWVGTCPNPSIQGVIISSSLDTSLNNDFGIKINNFCSDLWVDVAIPFLRPCFTNNNMYIYYCNDHESTVATDSVEITVTFDTAFTPLSSTFPWTSVSGNVYTFYLGTLNPGDCGSFLVTGLVSCTTPVGATLCTEAIISPIDSCSFSRNQPPVPTVPPCVGPWDHSSLSVDGYCVNDSLACFVIRNTGTLGGGDMQCFSPIRVYIDTALYQVDSLQLLGGDSLVLCFPANGHTWRLEADQHPLHPGNSHPNAVVELCGDSAAIAQNWIPGIVSQFSLDDANPNSDIDCAQTIASVDPNDKRGFPLGLSDAHIIAANTDLEYMIRFQNTGNDTAFTVVIEDILPAELDVLSIVSGASSHNYTFSIKGERTLEWRFENIMLPDSNINEAASHGFVSFRIEQIPNLPNGTYIHNEAAIYFDFNAPVITNQSEHLIGDANFVWIITDMEQVKTEYTDAWAIRIYPNPAYQQVTIQSDVNLEEVRLLSMTGQVVQAIQTNDLQATLTLDALPQGMYILDIRSEAGRMTKRLVKMK